MEVFNYRTFINKLKIFYSIRKQNYQNNFIYHLDREVRQEV